MNIQKIDKEINKQLEFLKDEVKTVQLEEVFEFKFEDAGKVIPWDYLVPKGIYWFEIKNDNRFTDFDSWIEDFKKIWKTGEYRYKFTPNAKKGAD